MSAQPQSAQPVMPDQPQSVPPDHDTAPINLAQLLEESGTFEYTTHSEVSPIVPLVIVAILALWGLRIITNLATGKSLFSGFDEMRPDSPLDYLDEPPFKKLYDPSRGP